MRCLFCFVAESQALGTITISGMWPFIPVLPLWPPSATLGLCQPVNYRNIHPLSLLYCALFSPCWRRYPRVQTWTGSIDQNETPPR